MTRSQDTKSLSDDEKKGADVNARAAAVTLDVSYTPEEHKRVLRKLDWHLVPLMCCVVLLQFLDKTSVNYANLLGMQTSLHMHGQQFAWLGSIFYIGWLAASPLHGLFLQKLHLTRYTAALVIIWGGCLLCHAAAFNYAGMVACRLFLGILEAGITPAFILLIARFYNRQEQIVRTAIWFSMNGWAQILGGLISYALLVRTQSNNGLKLWQEMFLILGAITTAFGILVFFFMPASPLDAKFLNERERLIAVERIRENKTGINTTEFKMSQLIEAFKDIRLYLFFFGVCSANIANFVTTFGSQIISTFGYSKPDTALLGMTTGLSEIIAIGLGVAIAALTKTRVVPGVFSFLVAAMGAALMLGLPVSNKVGRMAGYAVVFFYPVASPFYYSWLGSSVAGSTKRTVFNVVLQLGYTTGNIIGPQTMQAKDAPTYVPSKVTLIAMFVISALCMIGISTVHYIENKRRDRDGQFGDDEPEDAAFQDWTDKQQKSFRYPY